MVQPKTLQSKEISTVPTEETLTESAKETYSQIVVNSETQTSIKGSADPTC